MKIKICLLRSLFCAILLTITFKTVVCQNENSMPTTADTVKGSPHKVVMAAIGNAHIHIEYNSPAVRNRIIWGGLVPYNKVWVTGAHNATSITFSNNVKIGDTKLSRGKYALFTIPSENEWTVILNKNWEQHLTDEYSQKEDVLRFKIKPLKDQSFAERLVYEVAPSNERSGTVTIRWEKMKILIPIQIL